MKYKKIIAGISSLAASAYAFADRYGIDEALNESGGGSFDDMLGGGLLIGGIYLVWKLFS